MLRIPNPGSDIDIFIRIFKDLYADLKDRADFDLDDVTRAMVKRNNVSSQGAFGVEALRRSTRPDRSRDPLYNQSKMYSELLRTLGWIQSTTGALRFAFSWLGEYAASTPDPKPLAVECLLGIAYPNDVLGVQSDQSVRVFHAILRTAAALGGGITRDEMILGPLSLSDDQDTEAVGAMIKKLQRCRSEPGRMSKEIKALSKTRKISHVTMGNYTRFPIAAVQWAGWCGKTTRSMFTLTAKGRAVLDRLATLSDFRLSDYKKLPADAKGPMVRLSAYLMLARAGFDVSPAREEMDADRAALHRMRIEMGRDPLFSPFQQITRAEVNAAFPHLVGDGLQLDSEPRRISEATTDRRPRLKATVLFTATGAATVKDSETNLVERELLADLSAAHGSASEAVTAFAERHSRDNQAVFYPLVAALFRIIGFQCRISRRGVNYDRADAMIVDVANSIPIEIKSPSEETELSVKAIRQAVENKVILLSRERFATTRDTTTLAVGFNPPNVRSEVRELITDVNRAYQFNVGVLDLRSLAAMALTAAQSGGRLELKGFTKMRGVADAEDFFP